MGKSLGTRAEPYLSVNGIHANQRLMPILATDEALVAAHRNPFTSFHILMLLPPHIFLSPHRDDACFSLSATIARLGGGHLVNIFTKSQYVAHPSLANHIPPLTAEQISHIRRREDQVFCKLTNLHIYDLGLDEATLRGLPWNLDINNDYSDEHIQQSKIVYAHLVPLLSRISDQCGDQQITLYCPMAIGFHRDHVATLVATRMIFEDHFSTNLRFAFYEDLPYASWAGEREKGINFFTSIFTEPQLRKYYLPLDSKQINLKRQFVNVYASQHDGLPNDLDFISSDSWDLGPHEGLWIHDP